MTELVLPSSSRRRSGELLLALLGSALGPGRTGDYESIGLRWSETAGPSASLGMTKGRAELPFRVVAGGTALHLLARAEVNATLSFVIPSEAEGPAVLL